jgi:phosphoenolpyruvate carboxykinase (GTP)
VKEIVMITAFEERTSTTPGQPATLNCCRSTALANRHVRRFVHRAIKRCVPDRIYWCNGSRYERLRLTVDAVSHADPMSDSAAGPHRPVRESLGRSSEAMQTLFSTAAQHAAGVVAGSDGFDDAATARHWELFDGCMKGRTMYVVPFLAGAYGWRSAKVGIHVTDCVQVVLALAAATRIGDAALRQLGESDDFTRCVQSGGACLTFRRRISPVRSNAAPRQVPARR